MYVCFEHMNVALSRFIWKNLCLRSETFFSLFLYKSFAHYDKVGCFIVVRAYTNCFIAGYKVESDAIIQVLKNNWFTPFTNTIAQTPTFNMIIGYLQRILQGIVIAVTTHLAI